ncbi:MAG: response regulator transcription factor, partial [Eubacterium sp.]
MKILLVDDHALFSKSLSIALSDFKEIERFDSTKDITNLEKIMAEKQPDILLVDINLGSLTDGDGLLLARHLLENFPEQKIVILSGYDLPAYRKEAKRMGARGFISKDIEPEAFLNILIAVEKGAVYFPREDAFVEDLTESERHVLELVAKGGKRKEIAAALFISERTLSNHLQHIFEKLEVSSTLEAVTKAMQLGYL